jgi:ribosomal protein L4
MEKLKTVGKAVLEMEQSFFSLDQIVRKTGMYRREICHILEKLYLENIILKVSNKKREEYQERRGRPYYDIIYRLVKKQILHKRITPILKNETAQDRMWKVLRYLKVFTRSDLILLAKVSHEHAMWFTKMLRREGIVKPSRNGGPGTEWRLIKDLGPRRPHVTDGRKKFNIATRF